MLEARLHVVMGRASVSVWCHSHGPEHCLWRGDRWIDVENPTDLLRAMADALDQAWQRAHRGELEELNLECGS